MAVGSTQDLVDHLRRYHRYLAGTDWDAVAADATALLATLRSHAIIQLELGVVVGRLFALARKHGIRPMPEMTLVLLGMLTNEGMAKRLDPTADTLAALGTYLMMRHSREIATSPRGRFARGSRTFLRPLLDTVPAASSRARLVIARPPRPAPIASRLHDPSLRLSRTPSRSWRTPGPRRR
jgi:predicted unusual protein kinase regulating ubiquinone biosynthesis (AarF/ABC1/UbiB family)